MNALCTYQTHHIEPFARRGLVRRVAWAVVRCGALMAHLASSQREAPFESERVHWFAKGCGCPNGRAHSVWVRSGP